MCVPNPEPSPVLSPWAPYLESLKFTNCVFLNNDLEMVGVGLRLGCIIILGVGLAYALVLGFGWAEARFCGFGSTFWLLGQCQAYFCPYSGVWAVASVCVTELRRVGNRLAG